MKRIIILLFFLGFSLLNCLSKAQTISTIAGIYVAGFSGDSGQASLAELNGPSGVTVDSHGDIYITDYGNYRIRKISATTGIITTIAGGGPGPGLGDGGPAIASSLDDAMNVTFDSAGNMYIADAGDFAVRKIDASTGIITAVVGTPGNLNWGYSGDGGPATAAALVGPSDIAFDIHGNMYLADGGNNVIRKVTASTGIITTIAGNGYGHKAFHFYTGGYTGDGGQATSAELYGPEAVALDDSCNIYIADYLNNVVRKVTASTGIITTIAGNHSLPAGFGGDGGPATNAELGAPICVRMDALGNIYITNLNSVIRMVSKTTGIITTVVGNTVGGYSGNGGPATAAELNQPTGMCFDALGNMYIADQANSVIRRVTMPTGINEIKKNETVSIFPNPSNGSFNLSLSNVNNKCGVEIYNMVGEKIYTEILPQTQSANIINLTGEPNGIYFYRVLKETGGLIGDGKLIIEK
jgi:hypothetical protein